MPVTSGQAAQRQRGLSRRAHARCFNFNVQAPRMASKPQLVQARPKPVGHSSQNPLQRHRSLPFLAATRRQRHPLRRNRDRDRTIPLTPVCVHADYSAKASDATILQLPLKSPLAPSQIRNVFGFPRSLRKAYSLGGVLGAGSFGVVREATERATGRLYAVKSIPKSPKNGKPTPRYLLKLQTEVDAMGQLGASLDAVYLKDVFEDDVSIHLVMELCRGGSVLDRLKEGEYSERQVAHIMRAVLRFLSQCHAKGLVYRDVKPENFMLLDKEDAAGEQSQRDEKKSKRDQGGAGTAAGGGGAGKGGPAGALWRNFSRAVGLGGGDSDGSSASPSASSSALASSSAQASPGMRSAVKATDFGLAIRHSPGELPLKSRSGTPAYMAPEVINQRYDCQADVWSAGVMMWQLLTGRFPFWENVRDCTLQQVWTAILTQDVDFNAPELRQLSPTARDLLRQMLARDPRDRITASEALQHEWLRREDAASALPLRSSVVQRLQRFATYSRLKQLVFRLIADEFRQLPSAQPEARAMVDGLTTLFNELDVDASGSVSMDELVDGLERLGYDVTSAELEQLMRGVDANRDGSLQLPEFVAGLVDWEDMQDDAQWEAWVDLAFERLDQNHDGFISLSSLEDLIDGDVLDSGVDYTGAEEGDDIGAGAGDNDTTTMTTATVAAANDSESATHQHATVELSEEERALEARRMLREADANGDGKVSREEFFALLAGSGVPDRLGQYDSRLKPPVLLPSLTSMDEELEEETNDGSVPQTQGDG